MPDDKKIKNYSAADIEKYHKGLMPAKERHELEKAALDDPFLADAMEGYAKKGLNISEDIAELNKRLSEKTESSKVIPLETKQQTSFTWWRVAAVIVLIAGAGFLVYQFGFNKTSKEIAENKPAPQKESVVADSTRNSIVENDYVKPETTGKKPLTKNEGKVTVTNESVGSGISKVKTDTVTFKSLTNEPLSVAPSEGLIAKENLKKEESNKDAVANNEMNAKIADEQRKKDEMVSLKASSEKNADEEKGQFDKSTASAITNRVFGYNEQNNLLHHNVFRGRVMDANNNPLPFANITNTSDSVGTYADAKGNFTLISPDSVLNIRIQSLGFANAVTQIRSDVTNNKVTLHEDKTLDAVVLSRKKPNASRFGESTMKSEQPEPIDGWDNYDTYLANNLNIPETIRMKETNGEVELSFEVDQNGEPINIKIEKSLCSACDKEAIRLIKEGPKWKRNSKKGMATVTILF
jgi:outer membrane biosynthesis protein TonB